MKITTLNCDLSELSEAASQWLTHPDSLSKRLRTVTQDTIRAKTHFAGWGYAFTEESELLQLASDAAVWVRELDWRLAKKTWVCARTIIPANSMQVIGDNIQALQNQITLGDFLFQDATTIRQSIEISKLAPDHILYRRMTRANLNFNPPLWARRSIFTVKQVPVLVTEAFLPSALQQPLHD